MKRKPRRRPPVLLLLCLCLAAVLVFAWSNRHAHRHRAHPAGAGVDVAVQPLIEAPTPEALAPSAEDIAPVLPPSDVPPPAPHGHTAGRALRIAVVIDDVGLDLRDSRRAVELPAFITLSYIPYATRLVEQTRLARERGHELLLHMPMEPVGNADPGPGALLTGLSHDELQERFEQALASFTGFDGINNHMGSKFTADAAGMALVMQELRQRQLFFLDSRTSAQTLGFSTAQREGVPALARDVFLDDDMSPAAVRRQLAAAEKVARRKGVAIAIGHPHPATLDALEDFLSQAEARGVVFVPLHDLLPRQP